MNRVCKNMKYALNSLIISVALLLSFQSCAVKKCIDPQLDIPETIIPGTKADSLCLADLKWTELIQDTVLQNLIHKALTNNRDILSAAAKVKELEYRHRVARAGQFPSFDAEVTAEYEVTDFSKNGKADIESTFEGSFSWEVDFFGRLRWANRSAMAAYLASVEAQRAMQITIISEVATAYCELAALDNELEIVLRTLEIRNENVHYAKVRFEGGLTTEIPYKQALVEHASTASLVPDLKQKIETKKNDISILIGEFPQDIQHTLIDNFPRSRESVYVGIPSELIRRRPDLQASEQSLKAAMADVGMAWADRFPRFKISFEGGFKSDGFAQLFQSPITTLTGELLSPLFSFGKRRAQYRASIQKYEQARYRYEKDVLTAFKEVNNSFIRLNSSMEKVRLMEELLDATKKYVDLAIFQYQNGLTNYIDVLDAQRNYFNAEIDLSNAIRDEFLSVIQLYKALGGGWQ